MSMPSAPGLPKQAVPARTHLFEKQPRTKLHAVSRRRPFVQRLFATGWACIAMAGRVANDRDLTRDLGNKRGPSAGMRWFKGMDVP
jgi:hypothetical protein